MVDAFGKNRGLLLRNARGLEVLLVAGALIVTLMADDDKGRGAKVAVAALCAVTMGIQNTAATITRRVLAVLAMFAGALFGALLVLHTRLAWAYRWRCSCSRW